MEQWAKDWLEAERANGVKCLEIKTKGRGHYVYRSTTHWDKVLKKRIKTSKYLGRLKQGVGLIKPKSIAEYQTPTIRSVTEYGNSVLLREAAKEIKPILEDAFPDNWKEIYALVNGNPKFPSYGNENSPGLLKAFSVCYFEGFTPGSPGWTNP